MKNNQPNHLRRACFHLFLLGCLVNLTTGCFVPQPLEDAPAPATDVQVILTEEAAKRVSLQAGRQVGSVAGRVVRVDSDSLILAVRWGEIAGGSSGRPGPDIVRLAHVEVEEMNRPQFSLSKTLVFGAVAALLVAAIIGGIMQAGAGSDDDGSDEGDGTPDPT